MKKFLDWKEESYSRKK